MWCCTNSRSLVSRTSRLKQKHQVSHTEKRFKVAIMFSRHRRHSREEMNGFGKLMSSSKCSFTCIRGIFFPLNPFTTTVYARPAFYSQSAFYPWSAVCSPKSPVPSPQSLFYFTPTHLEFAQFRNSGFWPSKILKMVNSNSNVIALLT